MHQISFPQLVLFVIGLLAIWIAHRLAKKTDCDYFGIVCITIWYAIVGIVYFVIAKQSINLHNPSPFVTVIFMALCAIMAIKDLAFGISSFEAKKRDSKSAWDELYCR